MTARTYSVGDDEPSTKARYAATRVRMPFIQVRASSVSSLARLGSQIRIRRPRVELVASLSQVRARAGDRPKSRPTSCALSGQCSRGDAGRRPVGSAAMWVAERGCSWVLSQLPAFLSHLW